MARQHLPASFDNELCIEKFCGNMTDNRLQNILHSLECLECEHHRNLDDLVLCSKCGKDFYFCARHCADGSCGHRLDCSDKNHGTCWDHHIRAFKPRIARQHRQVSANDGLFVDLILYSETDNNAQRQRHQTDQQHEWFRVTLPFATEKGILPVLQVSSRFQQICNPSKQRDWPAKQYPSFVSFIGDTGVGKSTLIRAMITVGAAELPIGGDPNHPDHSRILLENIINQQYYGPVTRSGNSDNMTQPTSVGVHLYKDPSGSMVEYDSTDRDTEHVPLLFADCEGFRGGPTVTNAARASEQAPVVARSYERVSAVARDGRVRSSSSSSVSGDFLSGGMRKDFVDYDLEITAPEFGEGQRASADLFYARFLYAFSDVVVFVTKEDQKISDDMIRLLEWAASGVKKSVGRQQTRTLIIVRNNPDIHDPRFYNYDTLKSTMFKDFQPLWEHSSELARFKQGHDQDQRYEYQKIQSNENLFDQFFQDVKICYIPRRDQTESVRELYKQYRQLRWLIVQGVNNGQKKRSEAYDRYDYPTMTRLTDRAFRHFADSKEPFDFYAAARKDNPTPITIAGHMATLLKHIGTSHESRLRRFSDIVACCLVTHIHRTFDVEQDPAQIFENHLEDKCLKAIGIYQTEFQRCNYSFEDGTACMNMETPHEAHFNIKGLKVRGNKDLSKYAEPREMTVKAIASAFIDLYRIAFRVLHLSPPPSDVHLSDLQRRVVTPPGITGKVIEIRRKVLGYIRETHSTITSLDVFSIAATDWYLMKSNKTCFSCLQFAPDHVMRCGHGYCDECVKDFGTHFSTARYQYALDQCILCNDDISLPPGVNLMRIQPRCAGVRILTLDGGGIRGIVELAILQKIYDRVNLPIPFRDLFDLIVGTSTGGIIALALTALDQTKSLQELREDFLTLAKQTFEKSTFDFFSSADFLKLIQRSALGAALMALKWIPSWYYSERLQGALQEIFPPEWPVFGSTPLTKRHRSTRVAVTSTSSGQRCIFSNYSRASQGQEQSMDARMDVQENLPVVEGLEREDDPKMESKIWEAAMCTSAAPKFFPEFKFGRSRVKENDDKAYVDGALHSNLPVETALEEHRRIWPAGKGFAEVPVDFLISVGTGRQKRHNNDKLPKWFEKVGSAGQIMDYLTNIFNTDRQWDNFVSSSGRYKADTHYRLTVDLEEHVALDEWRKMPELIRLVDRVYHKRSPLYEEIGNVALHLTAGLFFFELRPENDKYEINRMLDRGNRAVIYGWIWCRLSSDSEGFHALMSRVEAFYLKQGSANATSIVGDSWPDYKNRVRQPGRAFEWDCQIRSGPRDTRVQQQILVKFRGNDHLVRISGFPVSFDQLKNNLDCRGVR